jgi:hypothetical protein
MQVLNFTIAFAILAAIGFCNINEADAQGGVDRSCTFTLGSRMTYCTPVNQWTDFADAIANMKTSAVNGTVSSIVFCPFTLRPSTLSTVEISSPMFIQCQQEHKCILDSSKAGGNTLVRIRGPQARVRFQGFVFQGAGQIFSAVHIVYGVVQTQTFCNCIYQRYAIKLCLKRRIHL